jgi:beta-lactam-binding protein with PASTA domain
VPPRCVVPKVVGKPLAKAWRRIVAAHCRVGKVHRVKSTRKRSGRILRQRPAAGKRLLRYSRIYLTVAR